MPDAGDVSVTLGDLALEVRSKNAGPFWMTLEAFMPDDETYRIAEALITTDLVAELYLVARESLQVFRIPQLRVIKVSFPRPVVQGSLHDRDMHAGQHHVPLANITVLLHEVRPTRDPVATARSMPTRRSRQVSHD